jgi:DNA-binding transcriptional ArsR family regulator
MPKKGKKPEWEKVENRKRILLTLWKQPLSHKELLESLQISRGTLSDHLRDLEEEEIIRKTRRNGKRVYEVIFDNEERIKNEVYSMNFEMLFKLMSDTDPVFAETWRSFSESLLKEIIYFKKRRSMDEPRLSAKELLIKTYEIIRKTASPSVRKQIHIDEILEGTKEMPESKFEDLEKSRRHIKKELKGEKNNESEN